MLSPIILIALVAVGDTIRAQWIGWKLSDPDGHRRIVNRATHVLRTVVVVSMAISAVVWTGAGIGMVAGWIT